MFRVQVSHVSMFAAEDNNRVQFSTHLCFAAMLFARPTCTHMHILKWTMRASTLLSFVLTVFVWF